jgi:hypothetical protein
MMSTQNVLEFVKGLIALAWSFDGVKGIVSSVALNTVVAISAALYTGDFNLKRIAEFLYKKILPLTATYFAAKVFGLSEDVKWLAPAVLLVIEGMLAGDLLNNLAGLGVPLPNFVLKAVGR